MRRSRVPGEPTCCGGLPYRRGTDGKRASRQGAKTQRTDARADKPTPRFRATANLAEVGANAMFGGLAKILAVLVLFFENFIKAAKLELGGLASRFGGLGEKGDELPILWTI